MVAQLPLVTKNWAGPVKFDLGQVKIIIDYIIDLVVNYGISNTIVLEIP